MTEQDPITADAPRSPLEGGRALRLLEPILSLLTGVTVALTLVLQFKWSSVAAPVAAAAAGSLLSLSVIIRTERSKARYRSDFGELLDPILVWLQLEPRIKALAARRLGDEAVREPMGWMINALRQRGDLTTSEAESALAVLHARNLIVHQGKSTHSDPTVMYSAFHLLHRLSDKQPNGYDVPFPSKVRPSFFERLLLRRLRPRRAAQRSRRRRGG